MVTTGGLSPDSRPTLLPAGIKTSPLKMTSAVTSAWWFVTLKVEWSGGRGTLQSDAGEGLNRYIRQYDILRVSAP